MSNKYYNSYDEFEEKVSNPEELIANATQSLKQAKVDAKNQQQNKEEFTKVYNNVIKQGVDSMKKKNDTWESIKDELYGVVKALMVKYNISDITTLDKVKLDNLINGNKRKVVHMYFSNSIKKDREALANAEKAKKEKEERIKKANADSYEAEKAKIEKEAKEKEAKASALNVSDDSKKVAEEIKSSKTAKTLTTALVGKSLPEVKLVQEILNSKGIDVGTADGKYGEKTKTGIMSYQKSKGLETDGAVGNNTWKSLLNIEEDLKIGSYDIASKKAVESEKGESEAENEKGGEIDPKNIKIGDTVAINGNATDLFTFVESEENLKNESLSSDSPEEVKAELKKIFLNTFSGDVTINSEDTLTLKFSDGSSKEFYYGTKQKDDKLALIIDDKDIKDLDKKTYFSRVKKTFKDKILKQTEDTIKYESPTYGIMYLKTDNTFKIFRNQEEYLNGKYKVVRKGEKDVLNLFGWSDEEKKKELESKKGVEKEESKSEYNVKEFIKLCMEKFPNEESLQKMYSSENNNIIDRDGYKDIYGFYYYWLDSIMSFDEEAWLSIFENCTQSLLHGFIENYNKGFYYEGNDNFKSDFIEDSDKGFEDFELNTLKDIINTKGLELVGKTITKK